ncbi:MAG: AraC family transcriptional regulator [bacterium]|nr:AraC family transcriptional regulator [Candidatus Colisoma equi]
MNTPFRYYPVTPVQKKWGLYLTCVGHNTTPPGTTYPSPEHPDEYYFTWKVGRILHEWQIILLEKGEGIVEFKNSRAKVGMGSLIVLPPGCWHRYRPDPKIGWTTYWIGFGGELADRLISNAGFAKDGEIKSFRNDFPILQLFAATVSDLMSNTMKTPFSAAASIPMLVAALIEAPAGTEMNNRPASPILIAQIHITEHLSETIDFEALAQKVGLTYRSFRYLFAKESGLSPLQYQLERRLARAKNLLASSDMSVKDIAETLGFNSTWYFAHFFQKHARTSPAAYRKQHRS